MSTVAERYTHRPSARDRRLAWLDIDELAVTPVGRSFMDRARCGGPAAARLSDMFFPDRLSESACDAAIRFCSACPGRIGCLAAHLYEEWGCWGGTSHADRQEIIRRLAQRSAA